MEYKHLTKEERFYVEQRITLGDSIPKIAQDLGRHKSSLYREIQRNTDKMFGFYSGLRADNIANKRLVETVRKKSFFDAKDNNAKKIHEFLIANLKLRSSPEQIASLFKSDFGSDVSHQTIYRHIWADRVNGGGLFKHLRRRGKKYRIKANKVDKKIRIGDFEGDTIIGIRGGDKACLLTLVDRKSKFTIIRKIPNKTAIAVEKAMYNSYDNTTLPILTITYDNGTEFANHENIANSLGCNIYFATPYRSCERGLNEHTNGKIRYFFPKKTDFGKISDDEVSYVQNLLNDRPRKSLNYLTPNEIVNKYLTRTYKKYKKIVAA